MEREEWRPVAGYEGFYEVSNLGNVRKVQQMMRPADNGNGYLRVNLTKDGKTTTYYVHRLVAKAFCGNADDSKTVNHINHVTTDNRAVNLEWLSQKKNVQYSAARMRKPKQAAKVSNTGEKYISRQTRRGNVRFRVQIKQVGAYRCFEELQDAVNFRDEVMKRWQGRAGCADGTGTQNR